MLPEPDGGVREGEEGPASPGFGGECGGEGSAGGHQEMAGPEASGSDEGGDPSEDKAQAEDAADPVAGHARRSTGEADSPSDREPRDVEGRENRDPISIAAFRAAVKGGDGNVPEIARALGRNQRSVWSRIKRDPELRALYVGRKVSGGMRTGAPHKEPDPYAHLTRAKAPLPTNVPDVNYETSAEEQRETYLRALKGYGISDKQLTRLRALDGLAKGSGTMLSVSLRITHQSYLGQLHSLGDVGDDVRERMKGHKTEDGTYVPLSPSDYAAMARTLIEIAKEARMGTQLILDSIQALARLELIAKGKSPEGEGELASPGWNKPKKVN